MNKEYDPYDSTLFHDVTEMKTWPLVVTDKQDFNREVNIQYFKRYLNLEVASYELRKIPNHRKRNNWDSAKMLLITTVNGETFGKRHNNSQHLLIEE